MKEKKVKNCKFYKCKKEVHSPKAMFCGEHERLYRESSKRVGQAILGLSVLAVGSMFGVKTKK